MENTPTNDSGYGTVNMEDLDDLKVDFSFLIDRLDAKALNINRSPVKAIQPKSSNIRSKMIGDILQENTPDLRMLEHSSNGLFQVTRSFSPPRKRSRLYNDSGVSMESQNFIQSMMDEEISIEDRGHINNSFFIEKRLDNTKIDNLVRDMNKKHGESFDFELDDQLRTRIYQGRFRSPIEEEDVLEKSLSKYLADDKENLDDPLNRKIQTQGMGQIKKSDKVYFKSPRRRKDLKSLIPVLKPISLNASNTNLILKPVNDNLVGNKLLLRSPKRICSPKKSPISQLRSALKYRNDVNKIYLVDSLTGSVNDATQFGTELNASNCEGFPLPEDTNEIVQIPTNDETMKSKQKMAIIKVFNPKRFSQGLDIYNDTNNKNNHNDNNETPANRRIGFYNNDQHKHYLALSNENPWPVPLNQEQESGVEVVHNAESASTGLVQNKGKNRVRWAHDIEW